MQAKKAALDNVAFGLPAGNFRVLHRTFRWECCGFLKVEAEKGYFGRYDRERSSVEPGGVKDTQRYERPSLHLWRSQYGCDSNSTDSISSAKYN